MAEPVNLRLVRKRKAREDKAAAAAENRLRHGRAKADPERLRLIEDSADRAHEAHRRDRPDPDAPAS